MARNDNNIMKNKLLYNLSKISAAFYAVVYVFIHSSKAFAARTGFLSFNLNAELKRCIPSNANDLTPVTCFVKAVTSFALDVMGALAFIMILYASIIYLVSYGDEAKTEIAKKTLIWSVIGIIAVSAAKTVLYIIDSKFQGIN